MLSMGNYARLTGNETVRPVQMISLVAIGICLGVLLKGLFEFLRQR